MVGGNAIYDAYQEFVRSGGQKDTLFYEHAIGDVKIHKGITYPQSGFKIDRGRLHLSKIGNIWIRLHRHIEGEIKTLTVKQYSSEKWFACFSCVVEIKFQKKPFEDVGLDVGLESYAVLSDDTVIEKPQFYRELETRLAHLQRGLL